MAAVAITNNSLFEQDQRQKQALANAKTQLETVLTSTTNPVVAVQRNLEIIFANPAAHALVSFKDITITGAVTKLYLPDFIDIVWMPPNPRALIRDIKHTGIHMYDLSIDGKDYICHITPLASPRYGWVAVLNNVTYLKEIDRLKSQMVRMTSHDLKNPLFAIMNYVELLQEDGEALFDDIMKRNLQAIWIQLSRMQHLIEGILDLEKVESGKLSKEICDLHDIVSLSVYHIRDVAQQKNLELQTAIPEQLPSVYANPQHLGQAISNLLDNAIKFTPEGGAISIAVYRADSSLYIDISDTGIGIPEIAQAYIFDRFYRVETGRTRDDISSGLGLSLAYAIIEQHYGEITVESTEGEGTTFKIILPAIESTN